MSPASEDLLFINNLLTTAGPNESLSQTNTIIIIIIGHLAVRRTHQMLVSQIKQLCHVLFSIQAGQEQLC